MRDWIPSILVALATVLIIVWMTGLGQRIETSAPGPDDSGSGVMWEPMDRAWLLKSGGNWKRIEGKVI